MCIRDREPLQETPPSTSVRASPSPLPPDGEAKKQTRPLAPSISLTPLLSSPGFTGLPVSGFARPPSRLRRTPPNAHFVRWGERYSLRFLEGEILASLPGGSEASISPSRKRSEY